MYPQTLFSLFPPFPYEKKVFVAMSFDPRFNERWINVIKPAIESVKIGENHLEAVRVDTREISDSILTEILLGIGRSQLVFADLTSIDNLNGRALRNPNVMYEVGLAHAVRLPEEVLLFRSDSEPLLFDLMNVRVNSYSPDTNPAESKGKVANAIANTLREVDLKRQFAVERAADSLDYYSWAQLIENQESIDHMTVKTMGELMGYTVWGSSIRKLLDTGLVVMEFKQTNLLLEEPVEKLIHYRITPFGQAVKRCCLSRTGITREIIAASGHADLLADEHRT